jgi:hypothetical protein
MNFQYDTFDCTKRSVTTQLCSLLFFQTRKKFNANYSIGKRNIQKNIWTQKKLGNVRTLSNSSGSSVHFIQLPRKPSLLRNANGNISATDCPFHFSALPDRMCGVDGGAIGWGTALQAGRSQVRFPTGSLEFFIGIILPAAPWHWGRLSL